MGPKCSAKVLSILPKEKKTVMYLIGGKKNKHFLISFIQT